ncbi:MAG: hypothetical protein H6585_04335 [Flavobacteriales bacterium]|nr:hypothetical protein [Flavobacteriales bacterium]MCB9447554.1 hypothetical protein [Flavobacteriales bacterium]
MKRVALFLDRPYVDAHYCFTELARHFAEGGYLVDLYHIENPFNPPPAFYDTRIRLFRFPQSVWQKADFWIRHLLKQDRRYDAVVGTPVMGAILANRVARLRRIPMIYLADEVFDPEVNDHALKNIHQLKRIDRKINARAWCTIALGEERFRYQKEVNRLPNDHTCFVIPNAPPGAADHLQSHFYRDMFGLDDKPIVLLVGTLQWSLAKKIFEATRSFRDKPYHMVLQGRSKGSLLFQDHPFIKLSTMPLPSYLLNYAISSADLGLVLYDQSIPKEVVNAPTGGKIGAYLKNKLPLIAGNVDDFRRFETEGVGVFWDGEEDIDAVIQRALGRRQMLAQNIPEFYEKNYNYSRFFQPLLNQLNEIV